MWPEWLTPDAVVQLWGWLHDEVLHAHLGDVWAHRVIYIALGLSLGALAVRWILVPLGLVKGGGSR